MPDKLSLQYTIKQQIGYDGNINLSFNWVESSAGSTVEVGTVYILLRLGIVWKECA